MSNLLWDILTCYCVISTTALLSVYKFTVPILSSKESSCIRFRPSSLSLQELSLFYFKSSIVIFITLSVLFISKSSRRCFNNLYYVLSLRAVICMLLWMNTTGFSPTFLTISSKLSSGFNIGVGHGFCLLIA